MSFSRRHHELRSLIDGISGTVPIDYDAVDAPADHVVYLIIDLSCVVGIVADVHMVRAAEPKHKVRVDLGSRAGIEQRMNVNLADVSRAVVAIGLGKKAIRGAGIVGGLGCERGGRDHVRRRAGKR